MTAQTLGSLTRARFLPILFILGCARPASNEWEQTQTTEQTIAAAEPTDIYSYAVGICSGPSQADCTYRCSGTLIAPNLVLTVRHCIYPVPDPFVNCSTDRFGPDPIAEPGQFWISTAPRLSPDTVDHWHQVQLFRTPKPMTVCGADIALLFLKDSVQTYEGVPATPALDPITDTSKYSNAVTIVSYGESGPGVKDYGARRVREWNPIMCLPGTCTTPDVLDQEFLVTTAICQGDSGAAAFDQGAFSAGRPVAVGVLSRGTLGTGGACSNGIFERLDDWASFMAGGAQLAATLGGYAAPSWAARPDADHLGGPANSFPHGSLGASCSVDADCDSQMCRSIDGGFTFTCTHGCDVAAPTSCPQNFQCVAGSATAVCAYAPPSPSSKGCALSGGDADWQDVIVTIPFALRRWRRRETRRKKCRVHRNASPHPSNFFNDTGLPTRRAPFGLAAGNVTRTLK